MNKLYSRHIPGKCMLLQMWTKWSAYSMSLRMSPKVKNKHFYKTLSINDSQSEFQEQAILRDCKIYPLLYALKLILKISIQDISDRCLYSVTGPQCFLILSFKDIVSYVRILPTVYYHHQLICFRKCRSTDLMTDHRVPACAYRRIENADMEKRTTCTRVTGSFYA